MPPREIREQSIRLSELAGDQQILEDTRFEGCTIRGPAVMLVLEDVTLPNNAIDSPNGVDAIFWLVPPERRLVAGAGVPVA